MSSWPRRAAAGKPLEVGGTGARLRMGYFFYTPATANGDHGSVNTIAYVSVVAALTSLEGPTQTLSAQKVQTTATMKHRKATRAAPVPPLYNAQPARIRKPHPTRENSMFTDAPFLIAACAKSPRTDAGLMTGMLAYSWRSRQRLAHWSNCLKTSAGALGRQVS